MRDEARQHTGKRHGGEKKQKKKHQLVWKYLSMQTKGAGGKIITSIIMQNICVARLQPFFMSLTF